MKKFFRGLQWALALASWALVQGAAAQGFPERPITFVVPFAAGSGTDQLARALAVPVGAATGQAVIVENKGGANGFIASQYVARAAPDGYTVLIGGVTTHAADEHLFKSLPYDPVNDFEPLTLLGTGGQIMVVNPKFPAKTVAEFVAMAKAQPGKYSFASGSSSSRMAGELLQQLAGIKLLHVPYKSNSLAIADVLGGQVDMIITDTITGLPQVKAGTLRALGVSGSRRSPLAPDIPTIAEAGVKGYEIGYWFAAYAPAKTPPAVVAKLNKLLVDAVHSESARAAFFGPSGVDTTTSSPEELAKFQATESARWGRIISAAHIEPE